MNVRVTPRTGQKILLLTTDAFGGHGGIALYNRDLAEALAGMPEVSEVVVLPRTMPFAPEELPPKVRFIADAAGGKWRYVARAVQLSREGFDVVICGHINLIVLVSLICAVVRAPMVLLAYGIDVWQAPMAANRIALRRVRAVWCISAITRDRMNAWARLPAGRYAILPNAIHLDKYGLGEPRQDLLDRYGLADSKVMITVARLPGADRYKGIDEVLEVMPGLLEVEPRLKYLIVGDGADRPRLEAKVRTLGLADHVCFAGLVSEQEKADHFRLADVFVMPGRGEGFGFVFLEALACGIPVVGSTLDGSREALRDGELGELVDPTDPDSIRSGIMRALTKRKKIPPGIHYFAWQSFARRVFEATRAVCDPRRTRGR